MPRPPPSRQVGSVLVFTSAFSLHAHVCARVRAFVHACVRASDAWLLQRSAPRSKHTHLMPAFHVCRDLIGPVFVSPPHTHPNPSDANYVSGLLGAAQKGMLAAAEKLETYADLHNSSHEIPGAQSRVVPPSPALRMAPGAYWPKCIHACLRARGKGCV